MADQEIYCESLKTTFKGIATSEAVTQFRNIKFASIPQRFARSELVTGYESGVVDATTPGPDPPGRKVPAGVNPENLLFAIPLEQSMQESERPTISEFECLNLSITLPKQRRGEELLPVFINIPGGANARCVSRLPLFDYTRLVETSISQGKPIIAIHVPYRVGLFGYGLLPNGKGGGNNALFDQRNAFEWVKRNIKAFGGDPDHVTAAGQSAGAFSIDCHLQAKEGSPAYFKRAIMSSGTLRALRPESVEKRIELTRSAAAVLGFGGDDWPEKLAAVSMDELVDAQEKLGITKYQAIDDGEWFEKGIDLDKPVIPKWVESIVIGDVGFEGFIWAQKFLTIPVSMPIEVLEAHGELGKALLAAYPTIAPKTDPATPLVPTLELLQDLLFSHPNHALISAYKAAGKPVYQYLFDQDNPWSPVSHQAHHACDLLYWFGGYDLPNDKDQAVSEAMKSALISYINGSEPWGKDEIKAFGPCGFVGAVTEGGIVTRRRVDAYKVLDAFPAEEYLSLFDALTD